MTMYIALLVVLLAVWMASFVVSGYELMSPVPLALLGLCVSVTLSVVGLMTWNHVTLGWEGFAAVATGSFSLLVGALLMERLIGGRLSRLSVVGGGGAYRAGSWKYLVVIAVLIIAICLRVIETYQIAAEIGADLSSYSSAVRAVRNEFAGFMSSQGMKADVGFSFIERQLEKAVTVTGYVSAYLTALRLSERKPGEVIFPAIMLALSCGFCFVAGSRGTILYYVIAFAICLYIVRVRKSGQKRRESAFFFLACGVAALVAVPLFYFSSALVGRSAGSDLVEYISFYYGCGTPALQYVLDAEALPQLAPGVRSFYYLFSVPYKLGLIGDYPSYSIAWVDMGGHGCNIFTGFARYYLDFGFMGVIVLSFLAAAFMTLVYRAARSTGWPAFVVLVGYLGAYAFDFAREEFVFSKLLSPTQFISVAIMLALTLFLTTSLRDDVKWIKAKAAALRGEESA